MKAWRTCKRYGLGKPWQKQESFTAINWCQSQTMVLSIQLKLVFRQRYGVKGSSWNNPPAGQSPVPSWGTDFTLFKSILCYSHCFVPSLVQKVLLHGITKKPENQMIFSRESKPLYFRCDFSKTRLESLTQLANFFKFQSISNLAIHKNTRHAVNTV